MMNRLMDSIASVPVPTTGSSQIVTRRLQLIILMALLHIRRRGF